jgi:flagellar FliL protein
MKLVLIALGALVILGGGAAGAYFFFAQPAVASSGEASEADKAHDKATAEKGVPVPVMFVELPPLILPIIDGNGVSQTVSLVVAIEVADAVEEANVKHLSPRLNDAYIQDMYGMLNKTAATEGGVIEATKLKARLNEVTGKVLGKDAFNDVLLQVVNQRRI